MAMLYGRNKHARATIGDILPISSLPLVVFRQPLAERGQMCIVYEVRTGTRPGKRLLCKFWLGL